MRAKTFLGFGLAAVVASCSGGGGGGGGPSNPGGVTPGAQGEYVVVAWNDLGMHCLNPSYDTMVILPPYNTVWAQVVRRGNPPQIVTAGLTVKYRLVGNTFSWGKGTYGQFWDFAGPLFGATSLQRDHGLDLVDPTISNGLSGAMVREADHFEVDGIPAVPMGDDLVWNPFQVAEVTVEDATGKTLVTTTATVPTSDEFDCQKCHGANAFADILAKHDRNEGTSLAAQVPVLCASCHSSPALGMTSRTGGRAFMSEAVHSFHGRLTPDQQPACYDCHPGPKTQCSRSLAHTAADGNCTHCHGTLAQVGGSQTPSATNLTPRLSWAQEPTCVSCHAGVPEVDTGTTLYRKATGHGGLYCAGCHGSPHTMIPSRVASDQAQAVQYQGAPVPLGDCNACHGSSHGEGLGEFGEAHAGANPEARNACAICHTIVPGAGDVARWPHGFAFKNRSIIAH